MELHTGWLEARMPYMYFPFPPFFKEQFADEYINFKMNERKLTSPFDLYRTFQHILKLSGYDYEIKPSQGCPTCMSLFENIPILRSCSETEISEIYCLCSNYQNVKLNKKQHKKFSTLLMENLNNITGTNLQCLTYNMSKIIDVDVSDKNDKDLQTKIVHYVIRFETIPVAVFEGSIYIKDKLYSVSKKFKRLDEYGSKDDCVDDAILRTYYYCKSKI